MVWDGSGWLGAHGRRRIREGLKALLLTKSYERPYFKWRKDIVSRNGYFQWELAMPQRDYHPVWNALACRQVLHKHHTFMPYYNPGREVEKKKKHLLSTFLHQALCQGPFIYLLQSSHYPYEAGLARITNFGRFWKLHHIPSKWLNGISVWLANALSSHYWILPCSQSSTMNPVTTCYRDSFPGHLPDYGLFLIIPSCSGTWFSNHYSLCAQPSTWSLVGTLNCHEVWFLHRRSVIAQAFRKSGSDLHQTPTETGRDFRHFAAVPVPGKNISSINKIQRNFKGLKIAVHLWRWDKFWTTRYKET